MPGQFLPSKRHGYTDWEPKGDNKRIWLPAVEEFLEEYREFWPLTVRQCFYRLVVYHDLPKNEKTYKTKVIPLLVNARRGEHLPFEAITDTGVFDWTPPHSQAQTTFTTTSSTGSATIRSISWLDRTYRFARTSKP